MQPTTSSSGRSQGRPPGSFSPLPGLPRSSSDLNQVPGSSRPPPLRIDSPSSSEETSPAHAIPKARRPSLNTPSTPIYQQLAAASHATLNSPSAQQSYPRPAAPRTTAAQGSSSPGMFEPTLPSTSTSNLSQVGMGPSSQAPAPATAGLSASQIAAQAARSQTAPETENTRRGSGGKGPISPPTLSLTEASAPRELGAASQSSAAATAAANVVFPRSGGNSPRDPSVSPQPQPVAEKPLSKSEKAKAKLFSRPSKISAKDTKDKALPSPGKIGSAFLVDPTGQSFYNLNNSSSATIRPSEGAGEEKTKEKEKKHHFLSRQKQKLKDEYHLPLSSAASNSRPSDPNAPSSLYNFSVPASPGPTTSTFAKAKKDKKSAERSDSRVDSESVPGDWPGSSSLPSMSQQSSSLFDAIDGGKSAAVGLSMDDAWHYLKPKLLVIFQGEDLRIPVEDINRIVSLHIQWCVHKRSPNKMLEDLRELLSSGFATMDRTLRKTPEERFMPTLVELWLFTFTSILPYLQAALLPLDLEVSGCGTIMTAEQARDFWGGVVTAPSPSPSDGQPAQVLPASAVLDVRRLVLTAYRDAVILPRYDTLKTIFSRLSLEFLPSAFANMALASPPLEPSLSASPPESFFSMARPGTAMSLDPSVGSYNSTSTTLLGDGSAGSRSRAVSNVSLGSRNSDGVIRPFTPSGMQALSSVREQNVEDSKQVADMVGRMLQCMSVLSSIGGVGGDVDDEGNRKMVELCKMLKLNWLGRGRTGRNRMGIVGGRVRRDEIREEPRTGASELAFGAGIAC
ncbi:HbrB-like protein [Trichoderma longibrachiatum ATCC 18648]|uniref:HbrB-like protein n=1 Tax=Trichoderma longibrachiatum ATCC 18648 TaxID=983965 RepID=A0A2T4BXT7_TRILO|nr:HbrB-like protein [Trichoderma longibrachiatum ATCC 18648]